MQEKNTAPLALTTPVRYFKGVGQKRAELLANLGLKTVRDLLYYLPRRYEDRSHFTPVSQAAAGQMQTFRGHIVTVAGRRTQRGSVLVQATITDRTGLIQAVWFNQPYLADQLKKGAEIVVYGKVERYDRLQITQPEYELLTGDETDSVHIGRIVPVYALTSQVSQRSLRALIFSAVTKCAAAVPESLPTYIIAREHIVDIHFALNNIHFPSNFDALEKAYRRIVFEEFFILQLALALKKRTVAVAHTGRQHTIAGELTASFKAALPFTLTAGQERTIADIERDMARPQPMHRLVEGDVGSGKTIVAAYAAVITVQNGFQCAYMAPTDVLARQHFITLSSALMPLGVRVELLVSDMDPAAKKRIRAAIADGAVDIIVGTHALIQEAVAFKDLGLVVIDEQHKFGVSQRALLQQKGYHPHVLIMTATPIPRTLALTVYGDLDISVIKELPKGRTPIVTYWVEDQKRDEAYRFVREELEKKRQAYIVCPRIDDAGHAAAGPKGSLQLFERLRTTVFGNFNVALLHGRMSAREKEAAMKAFKKGTVDVLVSTTVIEVGIDVPNATVMLVENAERFGLSQLHQLRGRVGRSTHESYCILLADPKTAAARQRLEAIEGTLDGFQIAEADLSIRGPGEFFGTRQHGLPEIKFGNIVKDMDIMERARQVAFDIVAKDPALAQEHHQKLRRALHAAFNDRIELAKVG